MSTNHPTWDIPGWRTNMSLIVDFGANYPAWEILHPQYRAEMLGPYLPYFLRTDDARGAVAQFDERYPHGGWRSFAKDKVKLTPSNHLKYPGDPPQPPLAQCRLGNELIIIYPADFVAVIQPDRSFDVARLD